MNSIKLLNLASLIKGHKNTATSVVSLVLLGFLCFKWFKGEISFPEFAEYCGMIATIVTIIIGFLAPDGKTGVGKQEDRAALIAEIKEQLKQQPIQENEEAKTPVCNCGNANAGCQCMLPKAD